jgi:hypothetical protein
VEKKLRGGTHEGGIGRRRTARPRSAGRWSKLKGVVLGEAASRSPRVGDALHRVGAHAVLGGDHTKAARALLPEITQAVAFRYVDLARELQIPATDPAGIRSALCDRDGFEPVAAEQKDRRDWSERHGAQLTGQFLIDRDGIVRWANIEGAREGLAGLEKFPTDEEFLDAARQLVR